MDLLLSDLEVRVLGALIEKEITTPDYYPLSLNALANACNQKSNRHPVMALDEGAVREALDSLSQKWLAGPTSTAESRVTKFGHRAQEVFNFDRRQTAVLCELMLRGPQTLGELRAHAERMYRFDDLETLEATLLKLSERQPPLVKKLPRLPGTKEPRYAQLLAGDKAGVDGRRGTGCRGRFAMAGRPHPPPRSRGGGTEAATGRPARAVCSIQKAI